MRAGIHPNYQKVLYIDTSTGDEWVGFSTIESGEKKSVGGEELPVIKVEISALSHPFWTGKARNVDTEGRIDRFKRRYARKGK